jgi:hypothetical protein
MHGNVFQLAEEGRKPNQYTITMKALKYCANIELSYPDDLATLFDDNCTQPLIVQPSDEPPIECIRNNVVFKEHRKFISWKYECEEFDKRETTLKGNLIKLYTVTIMQCSQAVKLKVQSTEGHDKAEKGSDCTWLFRTLRNICHKFEHSENRFLALVTAKENILKYKQSASQTTNDYFDVFKELLSVLESYGGVCTTQPHRRRAVSTPNLAS